jgi:polyphosphate kinase
MTRNLDFRVEVTCPIYDPRLQQRIQAIIDLQWHDNVKARILDELQRNEFKSRRGGRLRSQEAIDVYLRTGELPAFLRKD